MSAWEGSIGMTGEWYTPAYIFDALRCVFDTDVAHPAGMKTFVPARRIISSGSLEADWTGFIWMNPPFGKRNGLEPWLSKFIDHGNGIALVPDRTSAPWFQNAARQMDALLFLSPKVKFYRPDGSTGDSPGTGTVLMALGKIGAGALRTATPLGWLVIQGKTND